MLLPEQALRPPQQQQDRECIDEDCAALRQVFLEHEISTR
jgi:hypothetical protein